MKINFFFSAFLLVCLSLSAQPYEQPDNPTEAGIRNYLNTNNTDAIEGIYRGMTAGHSRLGIRKTSENKYVAIVLDVDPRLKKRWKTGDVKGYFESTSLPYLYSVRWIWNNKTSKELKADYYSDGILVISDLLENIKYIKLYPTNTCEY